MTLVTPACGSVARPVYVKPTERVLAATASGEKVAVYDVVTNVGTVAEVKVWSNGVDHGVVDGKPVTLVHVGMQVTNTGDVPIAIDEPDFRIDAGDVKSVLSTRAEAVEVPPAAARHVDSYFAARTDRPQDVGAFIFRWALQANGHAYHQSTAFVDDPSLEPSPFAKKFRPPVTHRHEPVVIHDGLVAAP